MALPRLRPIDLLPDLDPLRDWLDGTLVLGTAGADEIEVQGRMKVVFAGRGNDLVLSDTGAGSAKALGNLLMGGQGDDQLTTLGGRNALLGDQGHDTLTLGDRFQPGESHHGIAFGGSGDDRISAFGSNHRIYGDGGNDTLILGGPIGLDNAAFGGSGNDTLTSHSRRTTLDGGSGNDLLMSFSAGPARTHLVESGVTLTGGSGADRFALHNQSVLLAHGDTDGALSEGDALSGVIDVITDYQAGERVILGGGGEAALREAPVHLAGITWPGTGGGRAPLLHDGDYAYLRGALTGAGRFTIGAEGEDLLLIYDRPDGTDTPQTGAVAFLGWSEDSVLIA
ncbi:calcium-binding protein [Teichococcus aerofrigidensis]